MVLNDLIILFEKSSGCFRIKVTNACKNEEDFLNVERRIAKDWHVLKQTSKITVNVVQTLLIPVQRRDHEPDTDMYCIP